MITIHTAAGKLFSGMITVMNSSKKFRSIVKDLSIRCRKLNISLIQTLQITWNQACNVGVTSHLGLIYLKKSWAILRRHHDVTTGTSMRRAYLRHLCDILLVCK